jgi:succinate dehydrogenase/fumarate reductase flavoprotein subunit
VCGARGYQLQKERGWEVRAKAVVLATGGCTWKSKSLGGDVNTGDGQLFAAEVGATLSGMEFSNFYGIVPRQTSMDKNGYYGLATFTREDRSVIDGALFAGRAPLLRAALEGPVYAQFDRAPREHWDVMRRAMPNFFMVMDKLGEEPFTRRFAIDFVLEGTVRGTGGLVVRDDECWSGVPGLFLAGDVASREVIVGGATGAGAPNAAWAVSSGTWAGRAASRRARTQTQVPDQVRGAGTLGLRPAGKAGEPEAWRDLLRAVQAEVFPLDKNGLRTASVLEASRGRLDALFREARGGLYGQGKHAVRARESAAMLAMARWAYASALARTESRAMHTRLDHPTLDAAQQHRIECGGLDSVWTRPDPALPVLGAGWLAA